MDLNEKLWIQAAVEGDIESFEKLIKIYEKRIYNICLRLLKDQEEAYDAAQEVCIKIWKQLSQFKGDSKFSTWVYRIATNTCIDLLRKQKKRENEVTLFTDDEEQEERLTDLTDIWKDMSEQLAGDELRSVIWQGIQELKVDHRMVIVLRDVEGKSYDEIANALGVSIGTIKSRLSRARQQLKKMLEQNKEPYRSFFRHNNR